MVIVFWYSPQVVEMKFLRLKISEKDIVKWMIEYYCSCNHNTAGICDECSDLLNYAVKRNDNCLHGNNKPVCSVCEIHCYSATYRDRIREVMKFSGPRILYRKPLWGVMYLVKKKTGTGYKTKKPSWWGFFINSNL